MNKKNLIVTLPLIISFTLSGCQSQSKVNFTFIPSSKEPSKILDQEAETQLTQTASSTNQAINKLSAIELSANPAFKMPPRINPKVLGMNQIISIDWFGTVEPLLKELARASHYKLRILGPAPTIPALVKINANQLPVADILRDVTFQLANKQARIRIYPKIKIIELRYFRLSQPVK